MEYLRIPFVVRKLPGNRFLMMRPCLVISLASRNVILLVLRLIRNLEQLLVETFMQTYCGKFMDIYT